MNPLIDMALGQGATSSISPSNTSSATAATGNQTVNQGDIITGGSSKSPIPNVFWIGLAVFAICVLIKKKT